jgi:tight adherence protein B
MLFIGVFSFLVLFAAILVAVVFGLNYLEVQRRKQVGQMLQTVEGSAVAQETPVLREEKTGQGSFSFFSDSDAFRSLEAQLRQSSLDWSVGKLFVSTLVAGFAGLLFGLRVPVLIDPFLSALASMLVFGCLPLVYMRSKRNRRFRQIEEQLPDALDFLARSVRAGHALSISLELVADETPDPLGAELRTLCNEQKLGAAMDIALKHMAERVPTVDIRFFVSSLILQRETGGNLGEILNKLAYVMRERFRLRGQVRAASAHGRLTGIILTLLPLVLVLGLMVVAPDYLKQMAHDKDGKILIVCAFLGQIMGYAFIRKIVRIKI